MTGSSKTAQAISRLTPEQFRVTQQNGTEHPFRNEFHDHHAAGLYVDIVSGEPLFTSRDKFDSGTGWPSFTRPLEPDNIVERTDRSWFSVRTEVRTFCVPTIPPTPALARRSARWPTPLGANRKPCKPFFRGCR